jgi:hypothetical protein
MISRIIAIICVVLLVSSQLLGQTEINPDGVIVAGNWLANTGTLPEAIDEGQPGDGNTTYIYNSTAADIGIFTLEDVADPNSTATHTMHLQVRTQNPNTFTVILYQGGSPISVWNQSHGGGFGIYSHDLEISEINSITDYNDLRMGVLHIQNTADRVSQMSLIVPPPVASGYPNKVNGATVGAVKGVSDPAKVIGK